MQRFFFSTTRKSPRHYTSTFKASNLGENLAKFDIYALAEKPENNVEMISHDAIVFSNLKAITSPNGALLLNNQIFEVNLKEMTIQNGIIVEFPPNLFKVLEIVYPKPELLVVGLGAKSRILGNTTRKQLSALGIRVETSDTRNSALSYDLLATERSPELVGALMLPPNV